MQELRPTASVIVPTYNRVGRLRNVIEALERQHFPRESFEVIVVSDGSNDGTETFLHSLQPTMKFSWISQNNRGPAAARNAGVNKAVGEFIVFIDDDVVPEVGLLSAHLRSHDEAKRDVVVLGPLLAPEGFGMTPWVRWEHAMLMKQYGAMLRGEWQPSARQFYTGNASVRRAHILAAGGFDEGLRRAEDVELAYRLAARGLDFVFTIKAAGMHYAERSYQSWLDAAYAYGRNDVIFARDRNEKWLFPIVHREFQDRNGMLRLLVRLCGGRARLTSLMMSALKLAADAAPLVGSDRIELSAYSALFGLRYYTGIFDEMKDAKFLFRNAPN